MRNEIDIEDILSDASWRVARRSEVDGWISISVSRPPIWSGLEFDIEAPDDPKSVISLAVAVLADRPAYSDLIRHVAKAPRELEVPGLALELCRLVHAGLSSSPAGRTVPDLLAEHAVLPQHEAAWIARFADLLHRTQDYPK